MSTNKTVEMLRRYRDAWLAVHNGLTALDTIIADYADPDAPGCTPTRYEVDMLNGLAQALAALVERNSWE